MLLVYQKQIFTRGLGLLLCVSIFVYSPYFAFADEVNSAMQGQNNPGAYGQSYASQLPASRGGVGQRDQQRDSEGNHNDGGGAAGSLASKLMSIAMMLIAKGVALNALPKCFCKGMPLIAAGMKFMAGSKGAKNASNKMYEKAAINSNFKADLNPIGTFDQGIKTNAISAKEKSSKFEADTEPDFEALRTGEAGQTFDDLEKKFGIDRNEFAKSIASGADVGEFLEKHGALGGRSLQEFNDELTQEEISDEELMEKYQNGEYDEYKNAMLAKSGASQDPGSLAGAAANQAAQTKSFDQLMGELFSKKAGETEVKDAATTGAEKKIELGEDDSGGLKNLSDSAIRALASNKNYHVSADLLPGSSSLYQEPTVFDRIRYRYKMETQDLLSTDYFIRLQSEKRDIKQK